MSDNDMIAVQKLLNTMLEDIERYEKYSDNIVGPKWTREMVLELDTELKKLRFTFRIFDAELLRFCTENERLADVYFASVSCISTIYLLIGFTRAARINTVLPLKWMKITNNKEVLEIKLEELKGEIRKVLDLMPGNDSLNSEDEE